MELPYMMGQVVRRIEYLSARWAHWPLSLHAVLYVAGSRADSRYDNGYANNDQDHKSNQQYHRALSRRS